MYDNADASGSGGGDGGVAGGDIYDNHDAYPGTSTAPKPDAVYHSTAATGTAAK